MRCSATNRRRGLSLWYEQCLHIVHEFFYVAFTKHSGPAKCGLDGLRVGIQGSVKTKSGFRLANRELDMAVREIKRCVNLGMDGPLSGGLVLEERGNLALGETADAREGVAAFTERRPPRFT